MKASDLQAGKCYKEDKFRIFLIEEIEEYNDDCILLYVNKEYHPNLLGKGFLAPTITKIVLAKDLEVEYEEFPVESLNRIVEIHKKAMTKADKIMSIAKKACLAIFNANNNQPTKTNKTLCHISMKPST